MTPERWKQVKFICDCALECDPESRTALLRERCGNDEELRREVESLLVSGAETGPLESGLAETAADATAALSLGFFSMVRDDSFGPYAPVRVLGQGGMGAVYLARQERPIRRDVALKVIKPGMDSQQVLERFEIERQALALMDHPNVARVLDAGTSERGRPYFVMEYVDGLPITQYCDDKALRTRERLQLFIPVCNALQHAHQKGIIHRDIKPSNVLVTEVDAKPVSKVIDFGIARAAAGGPAEREAFTLAGQIVGTPEYMSPEQTSLDSRDIDTGTDVYSLGVVLYELLVGALPLDMKVLRKMALAEVFRTIRETPVPKPTARITEMGAAAEGVARQRSTDAGQLRRDLSGDLDWIVMKAIDKDRQRRYASASEFGADIERFLKNEPVLAGPPGAAYRVRKFVARHQLLLATIAAFLALLAAAAVVSTWQAIRANRERDKAVAAGREANAEKLVAYAMESLSQDPERSIILAMQAVDATRRFRQGVLPAAEAALHQAILSSQARLTLQAHQGPVNSVTFSPDGKRLATAGRDKTAKLWDAATGQELFTLRGHQDAVGVAGFSHDGKCIVTVSDDRTAKLWDTGNGQEIRTFRSHGGAFRSLDVSPDCKRVAMASVDDENVRLWETATGREIFTVPGRQVDFSSDGKRLATGGMPAKLWDAATGRELFALRDGQAVNRAIFSPDAKRVATIGEGGRAKLWNAVTGRKLFTLNEHAQAGGVLFSPDGKRLALSSLDGRTISVWNTITGRESFTLRGSHQSGLWRVTFSPDNRRIATVSSALEAQLWDAATGEELFPVIHHPVGVLDVAFSPDGRRVAIADAGGAAKLWDLGHARELLYFPYEGVKSVAFSPDGKWIVTGSSDKTAKLWDAASGGELLTLRGHGETVYSAAFSPDGTRIATASEDGSAKIWDTASGRELLTLQGRQVVVWSAVFSPDGKRLATAGTDQTTKMWDASTGRELLTLRGHHARVTCVAFSPDGKRLVTVADDQTVKLWDSVSGLELLTIKGIPKTGAISNVVAFSPDGKRLVTAGSDPKVWDAATGRELLTFRGHVRGLTSVTFSPDGKYLATGSSDTTARVWDSSTGQELFTFRHDAMVLDLAFSPDGRRLAVADGQGVQVYAIAIEDLMALARQRVTRPLTPTECRKYFQSNSCPPL